MKQSTLKSFIIKPAAAAVPRNEIQRDQITAKPDNRQPRPSAKRKAPHNDPDTARAYELKRRRCFLSHWLDEYAWLRFDQVNGVMYCYVCRELKHLYQSSDIAMITGAGEPSFRKGTLDSHGTSMYHTKCMDVFHARQRPQEMPLAIIRRRMNLQSQEMYYNLFTSAYCVGLRNWSFRDFEYLCQLQAKNGVNIGNNYQNTHGVQTFIESIAHIQRSETALGLQQSRFFSLAADGSTDHGVAEQESVYVRYLVAGEPVNKFLGLHEVEHSTSDGVLAAIDTVLFQHADISLETQKQKLVNVNLDGAAVNMGMYNGVGALEKQRHGPQVTVTHCINHNLELALLDLRKDEPYLAIFEKTIKGIFSFYHYSPKRGRELARVAAELDQDLAHFGGIQQIRWVASQRRALLALHKNYVATCSHFEDIASTSIKVKGLLQKLQSPKFLTFLHFMMDFTEVIANLSEAFQADDLLVMEVVPRVQVVMLALVGMQSSPGRYVSSLPNGRVYLGVTLSGVVKPELDRLHKALLGSAIEHIDCRFSAVQESPLSDFTVLNYREWPYGDKELSNYGKEKVTSLVKQFAPLLTEEEVNAIPMQWLYFKLHVSKQRNTDPKVLYRDLLLQQPKNFRQFLPLIEIMLTFSMSTAIVERGFSHMNNVKDATRTMLGNKTLNNLLEVKINGPTLKDFKPEAAIIHWMDKGKGKRHVNGHKH